jgi:hypothetical protein
VAWCAVRDTEPLPLTLRLASPPVAETVAQLEPLKDPLAERDKVGEAQGDGDAEPLAVEERDIEPLGDTLPVRDPGALGEPLPEEEAQGVTETQALPLRLAVAQTLGEGDRLPQGDAEKEPLGEPLLVGARESVALAEALLDALGHPEALHECDGVGESEGEGLLERVSKGRVALAGAEREGRTEEDTEGDREGVSLSDCEALAEEDSVNQDAEEDAVGVCDALAQPLEEAQRVGEEDTEAHGERLPEGEPEGDSVPLRERVRDTVPHGEAEAHPEALPHPDGVCVAVAQREGEPEPEPLPLPLPQPLGVREPDAQGDADCDVHEDAEREGEVLLERQRVGEGVPERHCVTVGDSDAQPLGEGLPEALTDTRGEPDALPLDVWEPLTDAQADTVPLREGKREGDAHAVALR